MLWAAARITIYRPCKARDVQSPAKFILLIIKCTDAAIRRAGLEGRRKTNPVVDGQLVPRVRTKNTNGHGRLRKRRRDEPAAAPSPRARRH